MQSGPIEANRDIYADIINTGVINNRQTINIVINGLDELVTLLEQPDFSLQLTGSDQLLAETQDRQVELPPGLLKGFELLSRAGGRGGEVSTDVRRRAYAAYLVTRRPQRPPQLTAAREHYIPLAGYLSRDDDLVRPHFSERRLVGDGPQRQVERERLPDVTTAVERHPAFVLLGAPGSGKSTVLHRLALTAARDFLTGRGRRLPLLINLADYRREREEPRAFVSRYWADWVADDFVALARQGGVLLLADGLNEMLRLAASGQQRDRANAWERFIADFFAEAGSHGGRAVVASRDRGDYDQPLGLPRVEIEPLDDDQIRQFIAAYLPDDQIEAALAAIDRLDLRRQARIPYSLYILTQLYNPAAGDLPANRGRLFDQYARALLQGEKKAGHAWYHLEASLAALAELGYALQRQGESTVLSAAALQDRLPATVSLPGEPAPVETPPQAVFNLACRAGVLLPDPTAATPDAYKFSHQLLQEQFAAGHLLARWRAGDDLTQLWRTCRTRQETPRPQGGEWDPLPPPPPTGWEQTTILAAGVGDRPDAFVRAVLAVNPALAGRCLSEGNAPVSLETRTAVQRALLQDLGDVALHRRARIESGRVLGQVGDPRFEPATINEVELILPDLVPVPGGTATLGSRSWPWDRQADDDERPRHQVEVAPFYVGRYPVANAEYACFIAAGGYDEDRYWTPTGWQWRQGELEESGPLEEVLEQYQYFLQNPNEIDKLFKEGRITPDTANGWRTLIQLSEEEVRRQLSERYAPQPHEQPYYWDDPAYNGPNQPVIGVTWYEARAYCAWLTGQIIAAPQTAVVAALPEEQQPLWSQIYDALGNNQYGLRLPAEAEWEWAAGGSDHRRYPWGRRFDPDKANTLEGRILGTSPVGAYPGGAAACGALDLSGNVYEWTHSLYRNYPYRVDDGREEEEAKGRRVLRGGAWDYSLRYARVSFRTHYHPVNFDFNVGFRVVVAPIFSF